MGTLVHVQLYTFSFRKPVIRPQNMPKTALSCGEKFSPKVQLWRKMTNMRSVTNPPVPHGKATPLRKLLDWATSSAGRSRTVPQRSARCSRQNPWNPWNMRSRDIVTDHSCLKLWSYLQIPLHQTPKLLSCETSRMCLVSSFLGVKWKKSSVISKICWQLRVSVKLAL